MKIFASDIPQAFIELDLRANIVRCGGEWRLAGIANLETRLNALQWPRMQALQFDVTHIAAMDTAGAWLLQRSIHRLEADGCLVSMVGLHAEHEALLSVLNDGDTCKRMRSLSSTVGMKFSEVPKPLKLVVAA